MWVDSDLGLKIWAILSLVRTRWGGVNSFKFLMILILERWFRSRILKWIKQGGKWLIWSFFIFDIEFCRNTLLTLGLIVDHYQPALPKNCLFPVKGSFRYWIGILGKVFMAKIIFKWEDTCRHMWNLFQFHSSVQRFHRKEPKKFDSSL